jgi:serine/threonine protein phosphatase 1
MLIELYAKGNPDPAAIKFMAHRNGFGWWLSVPGGKRQEILAAIRALPLAIEIETIRGTVGLVHADVPTGMAWEDFLADLEAGDAKTVETCLWGRGRIGRGDESGVQGVGRVFVGHTPQWGGLTRYGNVYALDTGAVFGQQGIKDEGCLTMAHVVMKTESLVAPRKAVSLVDLRDDEGALTIPFGKSLL